jgi:spore maturation protein CgeB
MRIVTLDTHYQRFLDSLYQATPGLEEQPYEQQLATIMRTRFGASDVYSTSFRALGHEAVDIVPNCEQLHRAWLRDADVAPPTRPGDVSGIATAQILDYEPDVALIQNVRVLSLSDIDRLKRAGILVVGQISTGPPSLRRMRTFDLVVSSYPSLVERFNRKGIRTEYLALAFDPRVIEDLERQGVSAAPDSPREIGASFVGTYSALIYGRGTDRVFQRLAEDFDVQLYGRPNWKLRRNPPLRRMIRGEAWGLDMYRLLAQSRVVINRHGKSAKGFANNMRLFEATGMGALVLTEDAPNLRDLFEPGVEVLTYTSERELRARLREALDDDDRRIAIAGAGQQRTLRDHQYADRARTLAALFGDLAARAPMQTAGRG